MEILRTPDERFVALPDYPFAPRYVEVDGLRVHYIDEGPHNATPALLLHGEPSWSYLYRTMIPVLVAAGHRVIAPDLVGFGRSDKPAAREDYTYARHVDWMAGLLGALDLRDITLFCQDWGGLIGLRLVAAHGDRFARVVAANTGLPTGDQSMGAAFDAWRRLSQEAPDLPVGRIIQRGCATDLGPTVVAAYDAPFPEERYKAGAAVPAAGPHAARRPGVGGQPRRVEGAGALGEALPDPVLRRRPHHGRGRSGPATSYTGRAGAAAPDHHRGGPLPARRQGPRVGPTGRRFYRGGTTMSRVSDARYTNATPAQVEEDSAIEPAGDEWERVRRVRVAIVGAGFSGLGMAIRLKQQGIDDFVVLERGEDVGGTWRDNTYPGAACDVPSHLYSFSFAPNPHWSRTYSPQREIRDYLRRTADRHGVGRHIRFGHEVSDASWDEATQQWRITTTQGQFAAQALVLGNGPLAEPSVPAIPGLDRFAGTLFHSARWDHGHDLTGQRVAVIGTGASAIQFVPHIQPCVGSLTLFQRTPPWIVPRLDRPISGRRRALFRAAPIAQRARRTAIYWQREIGALGLVYRPHMMKAAERIARAHLEAQVADPALRAKLTSRYTMGCKRILLSDDFYPALTQPNVEVVTDRIRAVGEQSVVTDDGVERPIDTIILATGFHVTDNPIYRCVHGRDGRALTDAWRDGPHAYLGATVAGFPNLFIMVGPNTGLGHTSMVFMIESQLAYILDCLRVMDRRGLGAVDVRPDVQDAYNDELQRRMRRTVWASGCASWYLAANGRNTTLWPGFTWEYRLRTRRFDPKNYNVTPQTALTR